MIGASGGGAGTGGSAAGGVAGGGGGGNAAAGGGGGVGGGNAPSLIAGGNGGFGGGGGGGTSKGGNGGFGGGGGGSLIRGGTGGYGGGGGNGLIGGAGGFGGGKAGSGVFPGNSGGGGGGAGMGGAIFVQQGGTLTIAGAFSVNGNSVNAGLGGGGGALNGHAFGSGMFMQGSGTISFAPGSGQAQTISDVIADEKGVVAGGYKPPTGFTPGSWGLNLNGPGSLTLSAANMYTGNTTVTAGTLNVTGSIVDSALTTVAGGGALIGTGTVGAVKVNSGGIFAPGASGAPGTNDDGIRQSRVRLRRGLFGATGSFDLDQGDCERHGDAHRRDS